MCFSHSLARAPPLPSELNYCGCFRCPCSVWLSAQHGGVLGSNTRALPLGGSQSPRDRGKEAGNHHAVPWACGHPADRLAGLCGAGQGSFSGESDVETGALRKSRGPNMCRRSSVGKGTGCGAERRRHGQDGK